MLKIKKQKNTKGLLFLLPYICIFYIRFYLRISSHSVVWFCIYVGKNCSIRLDKDEFRNAVKENIPRPSEDPGPPLTIGNELEAHDCVTKS